MGADGATTFGSSNGGVMSGVGRGTLGAGGAEIDAAQSARKIELEVVILQRTSWEGVSGSCSGGKGVGEGASTNPREGVMVTVARTASA